MRELEFTRRENEFLRGSGRRDFERDIVQGQREESRVDRQRTVTPSQSTISRTSIKSLADLIGEFDGTPDMFSVWKRQLIFIKTAHDLTDDEAKILIGMKLKLKAFEWLHSRAEHLEMTFDALVAEIERMYKPQSSVIEQRKKFEGRLWRRGESFRDYAHDKIVIGNRIPIPNKDMLEYLIEGIPDRILCNQARMQQFSSTESLIEAFDRIKLGEATTSAEAKSANLERGSKSSATNRSRHEVGKGGSKRGCYNCGLPDHISASCPAKTQGPKCFSCNAYGHIASKCPRKPEVPKQSNIVTCTTRKQYTKNVTIDDRVIDALIDTGSDLTLMCYDEYVKLGSPTLRRCKLRFAGLGSSSHTAIGEYDTEIQLDGRIFPIRICVVSDSLSSHRLLIGTDFLEKRNFHARKGTIYIDADDDDGVAEILQINVCEEDGKEERALSHITNDDVKAEVAKLINEYQPRRTIETTVSMRLVLKDNEPVYQKARRLSPMERDIVNKQIAEWESQGIVRPSSSDYASPVVLTKKKDLSHRLCVDYRLLNKKIVKDRFPLPLIEDQLDSLQGAKMFSTLDLRNGFFHVKIDDASVKYTSFVVPDGQFEFLRVPFGLCNSPPVFQRYINAVFRDAIRERIVLTYMDDLIVISDGLVDGLERLKRVFDIASNAGLDINIKKCQFLTTRVEFLGHIIEDGTVKPSEAKIEAVKRFPIPTTVRQVQAFLGLTGYFRKFVPDYSRIARPLSNLLRANVTFKMGDAELQAMDELKTHLTSRPVLSLYRTGAKTELHTDASKNGYGAILLQENADDRLMHPIYFASGKTSQAEEKYPSYELEVLAIVRSLRRFRVYLLGIPFQIITDCKAFTMTMEKKDLCVRVARWVLLLEEFQYTIEHRPGRSLKHVDALSRYPLSSCLVVTEDEDSLTMRLKKLQREDDELGGKFALAEGGVHDGYSVWRGLLYKDVGDESRIVVPKAMQAQIIRKAHERGHFSVEKTAALIEDVYWMPGLRQKIKKVIQSCLPCIFSERKAGKSEGFLHPIDKGSYPFHTFHVDHLGPLPSTRKSYRHIFAVIDAFTKFVWLYATRSTTTTEVITRLRKQSYVFCNPRRIVSDRGTAFTSKEFAEYCQEEGISHVLTTTGIPRANGQIERVNRTLIPLLTKLSAPKPDEWYRHLEVAQRLLNTTTHRSTSVTPFRLLFGVEAHLKEDRQLLDLLESESITSFDEERNDLRRHAHQKILQMQEENRMNFNKKRKKASVYEEGDLVAVRRTQHAPGSKFTHKFLGPYQILKCLGNDRYVVRRIGAGEGPKQTSTAADSMKLWVSDDDEDLFGSECDDINDTEAHGSGPSGSRLLSGRPNVGTHPTMQPCATENDSRE